MERSIIEKVSSQSIKYYDSSHFIIQEKYYYSNLYYESIKKYYKASKVYLLPLTSHKIRLRLADNQSNFHCCIELFFFCCYELA